MIKIVLWADCLSLEGGNNIRPNQQVTQLDVWAGDEMFTVTDNGNTCRRETKCSQLLTTATRVGGRRNVHCY